LNAVGGARDRETTVVPAVTPPDDRADVRIAVSFASSISLEHRDINGTSEGEAISIAAERNIDSYLTHMAQQ